MVMEREEKKVYIRGQAYRRPSRPSSILFVSSSALVGFSRLRSSGVVLLVTVVVLVLKCKIPLIIELINEKFNNGRNSIGTIWLIYARLCTFLWRVSNCGPPRIVRIKTQPQPVYAVVEII